MEIVSCKIFHWADVLEIRNENREGFGNTGIIAASSHHLYMTKHSKNYLICTHLKKVIGFIGHIDNDIRLATRKEYQRRGVAKFMVEGFMEKYPDAFAKVKPNNEASLKLFESCGFKKKYYILEK
tara:strand:+ start:4255 stop:4629 length:375 start_codon:yes stop_codon:yes gene_type:complete